MQFDPGRLVAYLAALLVFLISPSQATSMTLICPNNITVGNGGVARWGVPMVMGDSMGVALTATHVIGEYFPLGNTEVTYTARGQSGLETNCTFTVQVISDGSPEITNCPGTQFAGVSEGVAMVAVSWSPPLAVDPDGGAVTTTASHVPGATFAVGTTKVTYIFVDDDGASSRCTFKVVVIESTQPINTVASCPPDVTQLVPPGTIETEVSWTEPTFNDVIGGTDLSVTKSKAPGSNFTSGSTEVLYVAMDRDYNAVECVFTVTVNVTEDNIFPVIENCPADILMWVAMGTTQMNVTWTPPTATDNNGSPSLVPTHQPGSTFPLGATSVTYTATDVANNEETCSFMVTVIVDDQPPVIAGCPGDIIEYVPEGETSVSVTWTAPTVGDNSGAFTSSSNRVSGSDFQASVNGQSHNVTITYMDDHGNSAVCSFTVDVIIDQAPVFNCPAKVSRDNAAGRAYADVTWSEVTVTDDYTSVGSLQTMLTHSEPLRVFISTPTTVTYDVTDERGNSATCSFTVVVADVEDPVWSGCPSDIVQGMDPGTNSAIVSWAEPTATDNSGSDPVITATASNPEQFFPGSYTVQYVASDAATPPNMATCEFMVTVETDSNVPVFDNCPVGSLDFQTDVGLATTTVTWPSITATDDRNEGVTITANYLPGETLSIGSYSVEYQAVDVSGNIGYCGFTVVVSDLERPEIAACPADQSFFVVNAGRDVVVTWVEPLATDNSGSATISRTNGAAPGSRFAVGTQTIAYRALDSSGNFRDCTFTIYVAVKGSTIALDGLMTLDEVRGLDGIFSGSARQNNLRDDLDDFFRSTSLGPDFVGIEITATRFNADNDYVVGYMLYLCAQAHYNEETLKEIFYSALGGDNGDTFATSNVIVKESLELNVVEFRGQFTLKSIESPGTVPVDYQACCADPDSDSYQALLNRVYDHFERTYGTDTPFRMSRILFLTPGSVVVDYTLTYTTQSAPSVGDLEEMFDDSVAPTTSELVEGISTGLYLQLTGGSTQRLEAICPTDYCLNGGTCFISNSSSYQVSCSCEGRYYGDRCEREGLSTEAIIAIAVGVAVFLLLLVLVACCCCYLCLVGASSTRDEEEEQERRRKRRRFLQYVREPVYHRPLIPPNRKVRQNDYQYANQVEVEVVNEMGRKGPHFHHDGKNGHAHSPGANGFAPPPAANGAPKRKADKGAKKKARGKGPVFGHEQTEPPKQQKKLRFAPSTEFPTFEHDKTTKRYLSSSQRPAPVFEHSAQPELAREQKKKKKKRRDKGPSFHADTEPERVIEMKERMFHEFSY